MQHSVHYICRHSFTHACTCRHTNTHTLVTIHILSSVVHHTPCTHTYTHTKTRTDTQTPTTCTCNYIYQNQTDNVVNSSVCGPCPHALGESLVCNNACGPIGSKVPVIYLYLYCPQLDLIMCPHSKGELVVSNKTGGPIAAGTLALSQQLHGHLSVVGFSSTGLQNHEMGEVWVRPLVMASIRIFILNGARFPTSTLTYTHCTLVSIPVFTTRILKIFIKNFKGFRNVRKSIETSDDISV